MTESTNPSSCRVGLQGDPAFLECALSALAGSGIEVPRGAKPGTGPGGAPTQRALDVEGVDVLVASISSGTQVATSEAQRLCEQLPGLPVVVVLESIGQGATRAVLRAGVKGIVLRCELGEVLVCTVRAAQAGQIAIPRSGRHQIFRPVLSHRENTVLAMVALGRTNAEIAESLHLEESTVKSHIRSLFAKLGVRTRQDAAAAVYDADSQISSGVLTVTDSRKQLVY